MRKVRCSILVVRGCVAALLLGGCATVPLPPPAPPSAYPPEGTYSNAQTVTLTPSAGAGSTYWTLDGSEPNNMDRAYTGPITVDGDNGVTVTLKAVSYDTFGKRGPVLRASYLFAKQDPHSVAVGKQLAALVAEQRHEEAVIELKAVLPRATLEDCRSGFFDAGGSEKDWSLLLDSAKSPDFETGANYGQKLRAGSILDADVVEYMKGTLKNAAASSKLGFSAGFMSVFDDHSAARYHLDTLWIWAMPSE